MEFKELLAARRSVRKFSDRAVPAGAVERLLAVGLAAPSSRNSRSTRFLVVDDPATIARMAAMRDYGSAFLARAPLAVVVLGDCAKSDLWAVNATIAATHMQLAAVDEGLATCWIQVDGRPCLKEEPAGRQAADYLRELLPIPAECAPLCVLAVGYSDFRPAPLPEADDAGRVIRMK